MLPYQLRYIENTREIAAGSDFYGISAPDFDSWYEKQVRAKEHAESLRAENNKLLEENLFPVLDGLHNATEEEIASLEEFAGALMDWHTNLDCGVYLLIHDALLRMYRFRKERDRIIKELYMFGMGLYYQGRSLQGIECEKSEAFWFHNEMVFTEAGSYLKFFSEIEEEQTKGFIIRALANIAICSRDLKRRVAISSRVLQIVQDDYYRSMAPSLPWDVFLQRTHMQMSSNRAVLSKGGLSPEELASVLESCEVVFKPESDTDTPNVRWLWPYYEMEYSCGFADLQTTIARMERLISSASYDQYDVSGLYANVQLPIYYGRLLKDNPSLKSKREHVRFLAGAYDKMLKTMMTYPISEFNDFFFYNICLVLTDYYETDGVMSYREITAALMQRLTGQLYIRSRRVSEIMKVYSTAVMEKDPDFFDDIDFLRVVKDPEEKKKAVLDFAGQCGLYHDFGLIKMNFEHLCSTRELFEKENELYELHTVSGYEDLIARKSTEIYADAALGHHRFYNSAGGYPEQYVRNDSPYRQMTDLTAIADQLAESTPDTLERTIESIFEQEERRYSPLLTAYLSDPLLKEEIRSILSQKDKPYYLTLFNNTRSSI